MSILITSSSVTVTGSIVTFEDIYQQAVSNNLPYVKKLGNSYELSGDLYIQGNAGIKDINVNVTVLGTLIQIEKGSFLQIGEKRTDLSTYDGGSLYAPSIKVAYGFGNTNKNNSGNLFMYNSIIDVYGFWGFFNSDTTGNVNHVELIDCFINGFGRIEGQNSILKNLKFKQSHGQYGILSPKGQLYIMENLSVGAVKTESGFNCSVYHNPQYANDLTILGGIYSGYNDLAYIESNPGGTKLTFINSTISNGYQCVREANNVDLFHKFTFSPIVKDLNGALVDACNIVITDSSGTIVYNGTTNPSGTISEDVVYYTQDRNGNGSYKTPHTVTLSKGTVSIDYEIKIDHKLTNFPLYLTDVSPVSGSTSSLTLADVQSVNSAFEDRLDTKLNLMESGIRQILGNVIDEVNQNETYFKETGFSIMM